MPVISMDRDDLARLVGTPVTEEMLQDTLPMMGAHFEGVEDDTISFEFFPNRPDLYSVEGVARALRGILGVETSLPKFAVEPSDVILHVDPSVREVRPHVAGALVEGVEMTDDVVRSLMELQEKLHATVGRNRKKVSVGVHDSDPIVPPYTYKAVPPRSLRFFPLQGEEEMDMEEILERHPKGVKYAWILRGKDRYPVIVDARDQVLSFPPIINGIVTTVTEETTNLFIDVTGEDRRAIRDVLNIITTALAERGSRLRSVTLASKEGEEVTPDLSPRRRGLDLDFANRLLGVSLGPEEAAEHLRKMRYGVATDGSRLEVSIPAYRNDILHPVDLVEDLAIALGYDQVPRVLPLSPAMGMPLEVNEASEAIRELMIGYGYQEVSTLSLTRAEEDDPAQALILNPVTEDHAAVRTTLIPSLLGIFSANRHRDLPQRVFEVGEVVLNGENVRRVAGAALHAKAGFTEVKSLVQGLLRDLGVEFTLDRRRDPLFIPGRAATVMVGSASAGAFGEISPERLAEYELGHPTVAFELDQAAIAP
jgi:phenylalanyl-tRNA synthetase beta chain